MKRLAVIMLFAVTALAADKWWDSYNKGVAAVNGGSWDLAAGSRVMVAADGGKRWRPSALVGLGVRYGRAPAGTLATGCPVAASTDLPSAPVM